MEKIAKNDVKIEKERNFESTAMAAGFWGELLSWRPAIQTRN